MKRFFFLLSAVVVSLTMAAQMQVWSNGTIIFSHDQTDVDSISFSSPMQVQANYSAQSSTSLAGSVYTTSLAGSGSPSSQGYSYNTQAGTCLMALFFLDEVSGYYGYNTVGIPDVGNRVIAFNYTISGSDIAISINNHTYIGKLIGRNGLVFPEFLCHTRNETYPIVFITLNR